MKYKQQIYEQLRKIDSVINKPQVQENWAKIIVHHVSTEQYNDTTESINELHHEIENMNPSVKLVTSPRWLTSPKRREGKTRSSIVITISDQELAKKIINRGLWIDGRRTKTERFTGVKPTDQCSKCYGFGHHAVRCTEQVRCRICAAPHETRLHVCTTCKTTAKECPHIKTVCVNCKQNHQANDARCEMIQTLRRSRTGGSKASGAAEEDQDELML